jgi:hypothetical protein
MRLLTRVSTPTFSWPALATLARARAEARMVCFIFAAYRELCLTRLGLRAEDAGGSPVGEPG